MKLRNTDTEKQYQVLNDNLLNFFYTVLNFWSANIKFKAFRLTLRYLKLSTMVIWLAKSSKKLNSLSDIVFPKTEL